MDKVFIVEEIEPRYSEYEMPNRGILACYSTRQKAEEAIKSYERKEENEGYTYRILERDVY